MIYSIHGLPNKIILLFVLAFVFTFSRSSTLSIQSTWASVEKKPDPSLSESERDSLRYHLEILFNNVDLIIKNHKANASDLKRQKRDLEGMKVYERVPLTRDIQGLKKDLQESAEEAHLKLRQVKIKNFSPQKTPIPKRFYMKGGRFQFDADQLVEEIHFNAIVQGDRDHVQKWVHSWKTAQMRLIEVDTNPPQSLATANGHPIFNPIQSLPQEKWKVEAHAFRFRNVKFPTLTPQNPRTMLPIWARKNPKTFSTTEPLLWKLVTQTESLIPNTKPYYQLQEEFLLNDARLNFFLSKAAPQ